MEIKGAIESMGISIIFTCSSESFLQNHAKYYEDLKEKNLNENLSLSGWPTMISKTGNCIIILSHV